MSESPAILPTKLAPASPALNAVQCWIDALNFEREATSPAAVGIRLSAWVVATLAFLMLLRSTLAPLTSKGDTPPLGGAAYEDYRYGMRLATRKAIFSELATAEIAERKRAIAENTWGGHLWSREDDRGFHEVALVRELAKRNNVSITQVYMVLDEGIRDAWPGPDGQPLLATTPPQDPRTTW